MRFLVNIAEHETIEAFKKSKFGKNSLYKINKNQKRLEACFDISYEMYYGKIEKKVYDFVLKTFNDSLAKRFNNKKIYNNNLERKEWDFYKDLLYDMIIAKKASIY